MSWLIILFIALVLVSALLFNFGKNTRKSQEDYKTSKEHKLKPLTRHPQIDHTICILCSSCLKACPETHGEDSPLGIVNGQMLLVNPAKCIGHAQCEIACPTGALTVTLGELASDPNMPILSEENESIIPGIFIAGELSGVPLVRNAIEQGETVIKSIAKRITKPKSADSEVYDVAIIGLGPSGLSATLAAHESGLHYVTLEQKQIGGTVANYPKQKMIMTSPVNLPLYGMLKKTEIQKEELIEIWNTMVEKYKLNLHVGQKLEGIVPQKGSFKITTNTNTFYADYIILGLGRRGTPRRLGVAGEDLPKVTYGLIDPDAYENQKIMVVGGGDSAIEAALVLSKNNEVSLSYRKESFFRIKEKNKNSIEEANRNGKVKVWFNSEIKEISEKGLILEQEGKTTKMENDFVFVLIGGEPPFPLLRSIGVLKELPSS